MVDADLKSYFDSIPHDLLMKQVATRVADGRVLKLIESFLKANIMEGLDQWTPMAGAPQGAVLSPLLSNIYLNPLDHLLAGKGYEMVRYADDFVILCRTKQDAEAALNEVKQWTAQAGLTLHPDKTRLIDAATDVFEFLGFRFDKGRRKTQKHHEAARYDPGAHPTRRRRLSEGHDQSDQPGVEGLVRLLQACLGRHEYRRRLGARAIAKHPASPEQTPWPQWSCRSKTMAQRVLCHDGTLRACNSPSTGSPIHEDGPMTGKPDAGDPPVRFGGRGGRFNRPSLPR